MNMNMNFQEYKKFIESIIYQYSLNRSDNWTNKDKYKKGKIILSIFEGSSGDIITIAENSEKMLSIYDLDLKTSQLSSYAYTFLTKEKLAYELSIMWKKWMNVDVKFNNDKDLNYIIREPKIISILIDNCFEKYPSFDLENRELTLSTKNDISYLLLKAGGNWEEPVSLYFYWSETEKLIKGYFPTGKGNTYNIETNTAYGSEDIDDDKLQKRYEKEKKSLNYKIIENIGFEQLKQHIERDYHNIKD